VVLAGGDRVDLLFSDVVMPGTMDGLDLAYEARRLRPGLKVLLTSGFPGVRSADRRMASCPFPLLNKPYPHDALARAVREGLDRDDEPTSATTVARTSQQIQDDVRAVTVEQVRLVSTSEGTMTSAGQRQQIGGMDHG